MQIGVPRGANRVCGKSQGYLGLPISDLVSSDGSPLMATAWIPTPAELEALNKGAAVYVLIMGRVPPPMKVEVGEVPIDGQ